MLYIKDEKLSARLFFELKKFVFSLECRDYSFLCEDFGVFCGICLMCRMRKVKNREELDDLTAYPELICHKDDEGGYVNIEKYGRKFLTIDNMFIWGDLDKLKKEVKYIHKYSYKIPRHLLNTWKSFYAAVISSVEVLEFNFKV